MNGSRQFGITLLKALHARSMREIDLVRAMIAQGNPITGQYVNMLVHNHRTPPPELVDKICAAMKMSRDERILMHHAAASDSGYRIK